MPGVYNVPMALDLTLSHTEGLEPALAMARNRKRAELARQYILGPIPGTAFMDMFVPLDEDDRGGQMTSRNAFKAVPQSAESPAQIYEPLAAALNRTSKRKARCPGFIFEKTIERSVRPLRLGYTKPHICCFTMENAEEVRRADLRSRAELGYAELFINVNPDPSCDFFVDPPEDVTLQARRSHEFLRQFGAEEDALYDKVERAFGLHIAFALEVLARQHRLVLFSISMSGSFARLFRWDRAGCIVSEAFDIRERPELLLDFLWRFSQVSFIQRGYDPTVAVATSQEETRFRDAIKAHVRSQLDAVDEELEKAVRAHYQPGHTSVVNVFSPDPVEPGREGPARRFVVSRPVVSPLYLEGRGTRGFWAMCCETGRIMFLKDTWRTDSTSEAEGDILGRLNDVGVRNVPLLVIHGDVPEDLATHQRIGVCFQLTQTSYFAMQPWMCRVDKKFNHISRRQHYRLVTDTAGYGLNTIRGTQELLHGTYDAFTAMRDALSKDSRIHRDLSAGNIVLVQEPGKAIRTGYLIDWEASDRVDDGGEAKRPGRAGTWDFMSIRMLRQNGASSKHTFKDDMEAMLYVVFYCGLLYLAHDCTMQTLTSTIQEFFRTCSKSDGITFGGSGKIANADWRMFTGPVHFRSAALQEWLATVTEYHSPPPELAEKYEGMWDAGHLDAFWSDFLQTRALDSDDRVVHRLSRSGLYDLKSPPTTPSTPPDYEPAVRRKRYCEPAERDNATEGGPSVKNPRHDDPAVALAASPTSPVQVRGQPLTNSGGAHRRSERIRNRRSHLGPPAGSAVTTSVNITSSGTFRHAPRRRL